MQLSTLMTAILALGFMAQSARVAVAADGASLSDEYLLSVVVEPNTTSVLPFEPLDLLVTVKNTSTVSTVEVVSSWDIFTEYVHEQGPAHEWKIYHADQTPAGSPLPPTKLILGPGASRDYFVPIAYDSPGVHVFEQPGFHQIRVSYGKLASECIRIKVDNLVSEGELKMLATTQIPRFFSIESSRVVAIDDAEQKVEAFVKQFPNSVYLPLAKIAEGVINLKHGDAEHIRAAVERFRDVATGAEDRHRIRAKEYLACCYEKLGDAGEYQATLEDLRDKSSNPVARKRAALKLEQMRR